MAQFTYKGDVVMNYPTLGIVAIPSEAYELDSAPDDNWVGVAPPAKIAPTPAPSVAPTTPPTTAPTE